MKTILNIGDIVNYATGPIEAIPSLVVGKFFKWVKIKQVRFPGYERVFWIKSKYLGNVNHKFKDVIKRFDD